MIILNVAVIALLLLTAFGWELQVESVAVTTFFNVILSLCMWYMIILFAFSLYQVAQAGSFNSLINDKIQYIVYILSIFGVVNASIKKRG